MILEEKQLKKNNYYFTISIIKMNTIIIYHQIFSIKRKMIHTNKRIMIIEGGENIENL